MRQARPPVRVYAYASVRRDVNPSHAGDNHLENRVFPARKTAFSGPWPRYAARKPGLWPRIAPVFPRHTRPIRPGVPRWRCPDLRFSARHKARDTGVSCGNPPSALGFPRRPGTARPVCGPVPALAVAPRRPSRLPAASAPASHPGFRARPPAPRPRPRESEAFARLRAPTPRGASIFGAES